MTTTEPASRPEFLDRAEADKLLAEAEKAKAEGRKATAEAAQAEAILVKHKNDADREQEKRERELTADERHHVYRFSGPVDDASVRKCVEQLDHWDRTENPSQFEIIFYSPGGSVLAGMALFDHILCLREKGWKVTTTARGYAASMAAILLQAGDIRVVGPESYLLIHEVSTGAIGKLSELEDEVAFAKRITERVCRIFAERSKMSAATIRRKMKREWWLDSAEAKRLGIVDEVR